MGSWLGRVAAFYMMSVAQLCEDYKLDLVGGVSNSGWLDQAPIADGTLAQLARLARLNEARLRRIQTPDAWMVERRSLAYCAHCLFVNPIDVTAPRWKREWLDPKATQCQVHGSLLAVVAPGRVRHCKNFDHTLKVIGRIEHERRVGAPFYRH